MKLLSILIALLFFGLLMALWTRDFIKVLLAGQQGNDMLSSLSPPGGARGAATEGMPEAERLARTSPAYLAFILGMAAILAGSTYALTGERVQAIFLGVAVLALGLWRKARLVIMLGLSQKWLPQPPRGGFAGDTERVEWEARKADMTPKALLKGAIVIFVSDMLLVGGVLAAALVLRGSSS